MTPAAIIGAALTDGLFIYPDGPDGLRIKGPAAARDKWRPILKAHKAELVHHLWAENLRDHFEERAAILEHDGGLGREDAEEQARRATGLLARNLSAPWAALREALNDPALPNTAAPVDRAPYGLPVWCVAPDLQTPVQQGVFHHVPRATKRIH